MRKKNPKTIVLIVLAALFAAVAVVVPCLHVFLFSNPTKGKPDRVSEGIVPTEADLAGAPRYERVVIFGVDGAGGYFDQTDTPVFDRIFANGSINLRGVSQYPTVSAPNWTSMFTGVTAQKHQMTNAKATWFTVGGKKYPTVFKLHAAEHANATYFSVVDWTPINHGIFENFPQLTKINAQDYADPSDSFAVDEQVALLTKERLKTHDDAIVFLQFDAVDHAGHDHGYGSPEFADALRRVDEYLGVVYDAYQEKGLLETTLFLCVSDHGHSLKGGHGKESPTEKLATLAVWGGLGNVVPGTSGKYVTHDLASVVLYALGVPQPDYFDGGVPQNLFKELG